MYSIDDYDFILPEEQIAQIPVKQRDQSRLLALNRKTGEVSHHGFTDIAQYLLPGDVMVVNNTKVIPGRLYGRKETSGKVEVLLLDYDTKHITNAEDTTENGSEAEWQCLIKASKQLKPETRFKIGEMLTGEVKQFVNGIYTVRFSWTGNFETLLYQYGHMPLPPYIKRDTNEGAGMEDKKTYQTVYAAEKGAIAAPTAGLHFSRAVLDALAAKGIQIVSITLHVGYGTFLPIRATDIRRHQMHSERFVMPQSTADTINNAKQEGRRVIAVGTTSVRTLEHLAQKNPTLTECRGECDLFIYPGFQFQIIDAMITNFHLPKSSLMMLVSAFAGIDKIREAYRTAIAEKYRFFSYGDAMFIH